MTENYETLSSLVQLRYRDRKLYDQLVKNYDELELWKSLTNKEQGQILKVLKDKSTNAMFGFLKYLKIDYHSQVLSLDNEQDQKDACLNNFVHRKAPSEYDRTGPYCIQVIYLGKVKSDARVVYDKFDKESIKYYEFLCTNGLHKLYMFNIAEELAAKWDPREIDRDTLFEEACWKILKNTNSLISNTIRHLKK